MDLSAFRNLFGDLQEHVVGILNQDELIDAMGAKFVSENALDVEYEVKDALAKTGMACVVMTPAATYQGHNGIRQTFTCDELTLQIVENPVVRRPWLKKNNLKYGTGLDVAKAASDRLAGPQGGHFGQFTTKRIREAEQGGLLAVTAVFGCTVYETLSAVPSGDISGSWAEVPFVRMSELSDWIDDYLSGHMPAPSVSGYLPLSGGYMTGEISCGDSVGVNFDGVQIANGEQGMGFAVYVGGDAKYVFGDIDGGQPTPRPPYGADDPTVMRGMDVYAMTGDMSAYVRKDNETSAYVKVLGNNADTGFKILDVNGNPFLQTADDRRTEVYHIASRTVEVGADGSLVIYPGAGVDTTKLSAWQWIKTGQTGLGGVISSEHNAIMGEVSEDFVSFSWFIQRGYVTSADISSLTGAYLPLSGGQMTGGIRWDYGGMGGPQIYGPYSPQQLLFQTTYPPDAQKMVFLDFGSISQADGQRTIAYAEDVWGKNSTTLSVGAGAYTTNVDPGAVTIQRLLNGTITKTMQNWDGFTYTISSAGGTPTNYVFTYPLSGGVLATRQYVDAFLGDISALIHET